MMDLDVSAEAMDDVAVVEPLNVDESPKAVPKGADGVYGCSSMLSAQGGSKWYSCRDEFHRNVGTGKKCKCPGFYYGAQDPYGLSAILDWVERALNLLPEQRCRVAICQRDVKELRPPKPNDNKNLVFITMSDFWRAEKIRFYFLTALCRSHATKANWGHPLDTILPVHYFNQTRRATGMFFNGYTILGGPNKKQDSNWCNIFNQANAWQQLARPSSGKELSYFYDGDCRPNLTPNEKYLITEWVRQVNGSQWQNGQPPFSF